MERRNSCILHTFNPIGRLQHKDTAHILASKSLRSNFNLYFIPRHNVIVNNCRRVIFRILTDNRVTYHRLSKISLHISLSHTFIDGVRKTSTFKVYLLTNFYEHDRHTGILTDWDHILSCNL